MMLAFWSWAGWGFRPLTYGISSKNANSTQSNKSKSSVLGETHGVGQLSRELELEMRTLGGEEAGIPSFRALMRSGCKLGEKS
jgi:hypothetical protein